MGKRLAQALEAIAKKRGYETGGPRYKRVPQGYDPEHPRAELLRHGSLYALSPRIPATEVTTPKLLDVCFKHCQVMAPLVAWLAKVDQGAA
jgi:hypothetical protein